MSDDTAKGSITTMASTPAVAAAGGLIDVSGLSFDDLSAAIVGDDLSQALDYIVASGQNGTGYYGFNSSI